MPNVELLNQISDYFNANPELLLGLAGLASVVIQYAVNHVRGFSRITNAILGLVAIPGVLTALLAAASSVHAYEYPIVVIIGQLLYHVYENLKTKAAAVQTPVVEQPAQQF